MYSKPAAAQSPGDRQLLSTAGGDPYVIASSNYTISLNAQSENAEAAAAFIEWLATQPWSNGRVGMFGLSYLGTVQWLAAKERPPHLADLPVERGREAHGRGPHMGVGLVAGDRPAALDLRDAPQPVG